jgi:hypothetical protein
MVKPINSAVPPHVIVRQVAERSRGVNVVFIYANIIWTQVQGSLWGDTIFLATHSPLWDSITYKHHLSKLKINLSSHVQFRRKRYVVKWSYCKKGIKLYRYIFLTRQKYWPRICLILSCSTVHQLSTEMRYCLVAQCINYQLRWGWIDIQGQQRFVYACAFTEEWSTLQAYCRVQ